MFRHARVACLALFACVAASALLGGCACGRPRGVAPGPCAERPRDPDCRDGGLDEDAGPGPDPDGGVDGACRAPCGAERPVCDPTTGECVRCVIDTDCFALDAPRCDRMERDCVPCLGDAECSRFMDNRVCDLATGTCSECTATREAQICDETSCDALARTCTDTVRGTVARCGPCRASSECAAPGDVCVPMVFQGTPRTGGYCLRPFDASCPRPLVRESSPRPALGSASPLGAYCAPDEDVTTCEAVAAFATPCLVARDCGLGEGDARCEPDGAGGGFCTYGCVDEGDCPEGARCEGSGPDVDAGPLGPYCRP